MTTLYRITTGGLMYSYKAQLQGSYKNLADAMEKVETHRQFNSYAEDPAAAAKAFQTRRSQWRTDDQLRNNESVLAGVEQAMSCLDKVKNDLAEILGEDGTLRGLNSPTGAGRQALGQTILTAAEAAVQNMNTRYGDTFIFAGADGLNVPLTWGDNGELLYRGVPVDGICPASIDNADVAAKVDTTAVADSVDTQAVADSLDTQAIADSIALDPIDPAYAQAYQDAYDAAYKEAYDAAYKEAYDKAYEEAYAGIYKEAQEQNMGYLEDMVNEKTYVDLGLGMKEDTEGNAIGASMYNSALNALNFLDYGVDADGDPKNIVSLMKEIGELLKATDPDTGDYSNEAGKTEADLNRLCGKLRDSIDRMNIEYVELDTQGTFLNTNDKRLTDLADELEAQRSSLEDIDPVEAITCMMYAQYCYNAALQIGNSVLNKTLIDYMN